MKSVYNVHSSFLTVLTRGLLVVAAGLLLLPSRSAALPSFARQTGLPCSRCHSTFPELTDFGRQFKLNGYILTGDNVGHITADDKGRQAGLWLNQNLPVSVMFQIADTVLHKPQPGTQNGTVAFPEQFSIFLAGAVSDHVGTFVQATYNGSTDHFSMDNSDIRYANFTTLAGKDLVYGLDLNNNPTVEDLWNSTPAWGFPWVDSVSAPGPAAATLIDGTLGQDVGGAGAYAMFNHHWYGDITVYRSMHIGGPQPVTGVGANINIAGVAPYWRGAWTSTFNGGKDNLELGFYGINVNSTPNGVAGLRDRYLDNAFDYQLEHQLGKDLLTTHGTCIFERSKFNASLAAATVANPTDLLRTCRLDAIYHLGNRFTFGGGGFNTWGSADPALYAPAAMTGSASGKPNSDGYLIQAGYWLRQNLELSASYRGYLKFNGGTTNYDGSGRNASQNNVIYLNAWLMF